MAVQVQLDKMAYGRLHNDHLLKKEHKYFCNKE